MPAAPCPTAFAAENGATTVDLFRGDADYGNVAFTRRHRFVSTFLYELPIGRGRRFIGDIGPRARCAGRRMGRHRRHCCSSQGRSSRRSSATATRQARARRCAASPRPSGLTPVGDGNSRQSDGRRVLRPAPSSGRPTTSADSATPRSARSIGPGTKTFSMTLGKAISHWPGAAHLRVEIAFSNLFNIENLDVTPRSLNITSPASRASRRRRPWTRPARGRSSSRYVCHSEP